jgi:hypothetical protein
VVNFLNDTICLNGSERSVRAPRWRRRKLIGDRDIFLGGEGELSVILKSHGEGGANVGGQVKYAEVDE